MSFLESSQPPGTAVASEPESAARSLLESSPLRRRWQSWTTWFWIAALVAILALVADRTDLASLERMIHLSDGTTVTVPDTFTTVDHPYHVARAETLRRALADGEIPRWIANHQGGYPAEFYPFGVPWVEVIVWALMGGVFSIASAHKIVVVAFFVAPVIGWWLLARQDRLSPGVAVAALAAHVAIPGVWWSGGYTELVLWGLITNVAGYVVALIFLATLVRFVAGASRWWAVVSVLLAAFAVACNTRSGIALAAAALGTVLAVAISRNGCVPSVRTSVARVGLIGVVAAMLAAPLLMSLLRFGELYTFVRYEWYDGLGDYVQSSLDAVNPIVFGAAVVGFVLALRPAAGLASRAVALTLAIYIVATILLGGLSAEGGLIEQLEPTRLMPFQRYLMLYLAAYAVAEVVRSIVRSFHWTWASDAALAMVAVAVLFVFVLRPSDAPAADDRGLYPVETTAQPRFAETLRAINEADRLTPPGSAIYVVGSELSWHQELWAPLETDHPLRYDNWLWLWHPWHTAPGYTPAIGHAYGPETIPQTFAPSYFDEHGIGAVVTLTPAMERLADQSSSLELAFDGVYNVYLVRDPGTIVTAGSNGSVIENDVAPERITATFEGDGGTATVRETWYPRWHATVNGQEVPIARARDGYMLVEIPPGPVELELRYVTDGLDWLARLLSLVAAALLVLGAIGIARRFIARR